ncbi:MAG TPA: hypothetical protein VHO03_16710 [Ignavibacteriales bacterium]|nr:hypothetical protein [Ignavibacteriales bacterium]
MKFPEFGTSKPITEEELQEVIKQAEELKKPQVLIVGSPKLDIPAIFAGINVVKCPGLDDNTVIIADMNKMPGLDFMNLMSMEHILPPEPMPADVIRSRLISELAIPKPILPHWNFAEALGYKWKLTVKEKIRANRRKCHLARIRRRALK